MKRWLILTLLATACFAAGALGQTTGTITVTGTTPAAVSITDTSNGTLSSTIALGVLTPTNTGTLTTASVGARLRSNKAYTLSAAATALAFVGAGAADGGDSVGLTDIGFGVTAIDATGANVAAGHTDTIVALFDYTGGYPAVADGLTPFVAGTNGTLNDLAGAGQQILSGSRISARGNIATSNNFALVTFGLATLPQYFTPNTSFSTTITLTIAAP